MTRVRTLSIRLRAIAGMVEWGSRIVDIGTDHAYLPIELVRSGTASHALAMDVRQGPLKSAREHVQEAGLTEKVELRLSDGFERLEPGEADTAIIAGMGGDLVIRILRDGREKLGGIHTLVLSPHTRVRQVRAMLPGLGFQIHREELVRDGGKYYCVICAKRNPEARESGNEERSLEEIMRDLAGDIDAAARFYCGEYLLTHRHPLVRDWLLRKEQTLLRIRACLFENEADEERKDEIDRELGVIRYALGAYYPEKTEEEGFE